MSNIRGERICNRIVLSIGAMVALVIMAAPMGEFSTAQFVTAKIGSALMGWALWRKAVELDREGRI